MEHYTTERIFYFTLDPVHVGAGGYRLGRVDLTIIREPGTGLPKIPGTSLSGAARSYAAMLYGKPEAAGQHQKMKGDRKTCPILYTFGTASGESGQAGVMTFTDARLVLFPVASGQGPVWVTTAPLLTEAGFTTPPSTPKRDRIVTTLPNPAPPAPNQPQRATRLNLGWMLFDDVQWGATLATPPTLTGFLSSLAGRIVIVDESLIADIVNANLEVRTSVAINPETGAAQSGALYSYEAIPRGAVLFHDLIQDNYRTQYHQDFLPVAKQFKQNPQFDETKPEDDNNVGGWERQGDTVVPEWKTPAQVARAGLGLIEALGVGGMGTRGFGRLRIVNNNVEGSAQ